MYAFPLIQIAGILDQAEADMLIAAGVEWLGFPFRLPVNKEDLSEAAAAEIICGFQPPHTGVLITYLNKAVKVQTLCETLGVKIVQLHGDISLTEIQRLRAITKDLFIIKSLVVKSDNLAALEKAARDYSPFVDAFITDTHDPTTGADGATGKTHDWQISRRLVEISPLPLILAGGIKPGNVRQAIETVRPAGVDAHTGVEDENGRKCPQKIAAFVREAKAAFTNPEERNK